jgi:hypothetical protein
MTTRQMKQLDHSKTYATSRYKDTGRHYLVTSLGHVWMDCPYNRKIIWDGVEIVWTTRNT